MVGGAQGDVGLVADVSECEVLHDGRAFVGARLRARVRIVDHWCEEGTKGLFYCTVEDVKDDPMSDEDRRRARDTLTSLMEALAASASSEELASIRHEFGDAPLQDMEALSFWLAAVLRLAAPERYHAMRTTSMIDRLAVLVKHRPQPRNRWSLSSLLGRWATDDEPASPNAPPQ